MKLLYAEDEKSMSEAVVDILTYHKYIVDAVYDGEEALDYAVAESYDGIILDELLDAIALNLINEGMVYERLVDLRDSHEVILTGRMPSHKIKPILDYSSEVKKHKHPYDNGTKARKGIEY